MIHFYVFISETNFVSGFLSSLTEDPKIYFICETVGSCLDQEVTGRVTSVFVFTVCAFHFNSGRLLPQEHQGSSEVAWSYRKSVYFDFVQMSQHRHKI